MTISKHTIRRAIANIRTSEEELLAQLFAGVSHTVIGRDVEPTTPADLRRRLSDVRNAIAQLEAFGGAL